jgi:acyl dehydratase
MPPARWFDDIRPGDVREFGDYEMTEAEIIDFARRFDPQLFHTDPRSARDSVFGGLVASGWHTASATMRMVAENLLSTETSMGSPGIDEMRWLVPVRPGDRLRVRATVTEARRSRSKPDRGIVHSLTEVLNQNGQVVMTLRGMTIIRARS